MFTAKGLLQPSRQPKGGCVPTCSIFYAQNTWVCNRGSGGTVNCRRSGRSQAPSQTPPPKTSPPLVKHPPHPTTPPPPKPFPSVANPPSQAVSNPPPPIDCGQQMQHSAETMGGSTILSAVWNLKSSYCYHHPSSCCLTNARQVQLARIEVWFQVISPPHLPRHTLKEAKLNRTKASR